MGNYAAVANITKVEKLEQTTTKDSPYFSSTLNDLARDSLCVLIVLMFTVLRLGEIKILPPE